ncbi:related to ankyrin [Phialocephala subalpina]|uniref:Related to ankyrin n=1 Tax=Phialocephala subalpina TaxID=576137 RepID=A0A1L7XTU4_9HELO|nr:related to ankyrin [Phialocephala subalpina]
METSASHDLETGRRLATLFESILREFADTDLFSKEISPTCFLVYAHDAPNVGNADAARAQQLIDWLKTLRSIVFADRSQFLPWYDRENGAAGRDILSNQFCILPKSGNAGSVYNISSVDKVILCCSEVLQSYYGDSRVKKYTQDIRDFYFDRERNLQNTNEVKEGIKRIVKAYSDREGFHYVLTELAFLEIRSIQEQHNHGIIPVVLNGEGIESLPFFKNEVALWLKPKLHSKSTIHEFQIRHKFFFKLLPPKHLPPGKARIAGAQDFACLRSLAYQDMNSRRQDTKRAHANTCGWITSHPSYTNWLKEGSGILWIKGKPGSGKSTLMEYLLRHLEKQPLYQESIQLSFFLHSRGMTLQKSRLGMFRSLLHQLLSRAPAAGVKFQHEFEEKSRSQGDPGKDWSWHVNELRDFFISTVESVAGTQSINIFVDALDEADDGADDQDTSREIVSDFHELNDLLHCKELRSTICFSCRHFPITTTNQRWEIWVEKENHRDISTYVRGELNRRLSPSATERQYVGEWQETIVGGAQGVFQWAVLVVSMTIEHHYAGKSLKETRQMLAEVPKKLGDVYKHILSQVVDKDDQQQTLRLMRWRHTSPFAPEFTLEELELEWPGHDLIVRRIVSLSGGLIESMSHWGGQILQFTHQSVNDFLSQEGLGLLDVASLGNLVGQGHHQLSIICANYIRLAQMNNSNRRSTKAEAPVRGIGAEAEAIKVQLPFMDYAARSWFLHAEKAETLGIPQDYILRFSQHCPKILELWVRFYGTLQVHYSEGRPDLPSTMLHIASGSNLLSVVKGLLSTGPHIEQMDDSGNRALHYASRWGHVKVVKALLDAGAMLEAENNTKCTALERAAANGHEEVVGLLLATGADANKQTGEFGNALYGAAAKGSIAIVRVLLNHMAEVNAQGGEYGNALQAAANGGHQAIVQLLLDNGADVLAE